MTLPMVRPGLPATDPRVHVRVWTDAIVGGPIDVWCPAGSTIAEIVAVLPLDPRHEARRRHLEAWLGDHRVPRDRWHLVRPFAWAPGRPVTLTLRLPIHGGGRGGGSKALSIIASLALISLTAWIGGGGLGFLGEAFKAGSWGARLAAGAVTIAGALAIQGLLKPSEDNEKKNPLGYASASNEFQPGQPLQRVVGRSIVAPQMLMPPYTLIDNGIKRSGGTTRWSQYVVALYGLAGRHSIGRITIDGVDIDEIDLLEYEIREGTTTDAPLTLVTDTRYEEQVNATISGWETDPDDTDGAVSILGTVEEAGPHWHRVECKTDAEIFRVEFVMPSGLIIIGSDGTRKAIGLTLRPRMRRRGASSWGDWIQLPELMLRGKQTDAIRAHVEIRWVDAIPATAGSASPWPPAAKARTKVAGWGGIWQGAAWASPLLTAAGSGYAEWEWQSDKRIVLYLLTGSYPKGRWQFEFKRSWPYREDDMDYDTHELTYGSGYLTTDLYTPPLVSPDRLYRNPTNNQDQVTIVSVQSVWSEYPIVDDDAPMTLLAVRRRNANIGRVQIEATTVCDAWDGTTWVADQATTNPAALFRHVLRDRHNAQALADELIDGATLADWAEWCDATGKSCGFVASGKSVDEVLKAIALTGWASPSPGATYSVVIDRPRTAPVGLVTQRNGAKFGFSKAFAELPHALRCTYVDEADDWRPTEIYVYAPGYAETAGAGLLQATLFETIAYDGLHTEASVRARAALDYAWRIHRSAMQTCTMDFEHLEFRRGDLVLWETDILGQIGGRGRIASIEISGEMVSAIELDEAMDAGAASGDLWRLDDLWDVGDLWEPTGTGGVVIRCTDGNLITHEIRPLDGTTRVEFVTPFAMPTSGGDPTIVVDCLVATGPLVRVGREVLIWQIAPGQDLTAEITAVDYAHDAVYGASS